MRIVVGGQIRQIYHGLLRGIILMVVRGHSRTIPVTLELVAKGPRNGLSAISAGEMSVINAALKTIICSDRLVVDKESGFKVFEINQISNC